MKQRFLNQKLGKRATDRGRRRKARLVSSRAQSRRSGGATPVGSR
ncbi:MAG TPA: hypothetical protein VNJ12_13625 [Candidatus Dormibacteraeota bacterium]|nr:hypothetical protein [Candidatus Dormibacteraeota bacterium]